VLTSISVGLPSDAAGEGTISFPRSLNNCSPPEAEPPEADIQGKACFHLTTTLPFPSEVLNFLLRVGTINPAIPRHLTSTRNAFAGPRSSKTLPLRAQSRPAPITTGEHLSSGAIGDFMSTSPRIVRAESQQRLSDSKAVPYLLGAGAALGVLAISA
jgi:hypothetical protein